MTLGCGEWLYTQSRNGNKLDNTDMVEKEITFNDGTHIFYKVVDGKVQRFIEYGYSPFEKGQIEKDSRLEEQFKKKNRIFSCGKYDYLNVLYGIACGLNESQKHRLYNELKELHDKVGTQYDPHIRNKDFLTTFGKYWKGNEKQCAAFFVTIYLAMLDLEDGKKDYPNSLGKTMVLRSCEAVILKNVDYREAATMFERKKDTQLYDFDYSEGDSRYEKYNGYNGYDDDTIDEGFDGFPKATWNVD